MEPSCKVLASAVAPELTDESTGAAGACHLENSVPMCVCDLAESETCLLTHS